MAKAGADVRNLNDGQGGFVSDESPITGFSHMHDSGTGSVAIRVNTSCKLRLIFVRNHRLETSPYFLILDATTTLSAIVSSVETNEQPQGSTAPLWLIQDISPLH
jgi:hypothetical protein